MSEPPGERPPGYPEWLERTLRTASGTTISVRPIRPDDAPRLVAFHGALSSHSVYMRFFSPHPMLNQREVERFTRVDYHTRLALIAEVDGELTAVARYDRWPETTEAEVAFVVADAWQHHGIAPVLLGLLAEAARRRGIETFTASTLLDNRDMLLVFSHSGFHPTTSLAGGGVVEVRFSIVPEDQAIEGAAQPC